MPSLSGSGGEERRAPLVRDIRVGVSLDFEVRVFGGELFTIVGDISGDPTPGIPSRLMLCGRNSRCSSFGGSEGL